eukprot:gb/GECH01006615.1/.p1 GENE.gb/GECH01006615.1/~~gb/GECH01006615.1/.p1  ORF type:complete len:186 (+),score=35.99 gb/GECH01006615.1/:1-558(+)
MEQQRNPYTPVYPETESFPSNYGGISSREISSSRGKNQKTSTHDSKTENNPAQGPGEPSFRDQQRYRQEEPPSSDTSVTSNSQQYATLIEHEVPPRRHQHRRHRNGRSLILGRSQYMICPYCGDRGYTVVRRELGATVFIAALLLILLGFWFLAWIPFLIVFLYDKVHLCPHCSRRIQRFSPFTP